MDSISSSADPKSGGALTSAGPNGGGNGNGRSHRRLMVIDDDSEMGSLLRDFLSNEGYTIESFSLGTDALVALSPGGQLSSVNPEGDIDAIITDIKMPQMDGLEFTSRVKILRPEIPVIMMTAFGSIETAIEAMKRGAFHYVVKPFKLAEMAVNIERALEYRKLQRDNQTLRSQIQRSFSLGEVIGKSPAMHSVFDLVDRVAAATANVFISGESGTGKEMIARAIHGRGPRASKPFIAINCTAIPETLLESELFGHAKGSFTGAINRKRGLFEEAEGGTLFLDEIGDMNVALQSKLLRVIQERKVRAVGDNVTKDVDVRIIAATHKDLKQAIKDGRFREDLYYRLAVIPILIPPLRNRKEDVPVLANHFLKKYSAQNRSNVEGFSKRAIEKLLQFRFEGNVRELENMIERAVVLARGNLIEDTDLPTPDARSPEEFFAASISDWPTVEQLEKRYMRLVLEKTGNRKDKAAQILGINRRTLYRKEREFGFIVDDGRDEAEGDQGADMRDDGSETEAEYDKLK